MEITFIIPSYNCRDFIGRAIESVINQSRKGWRLIVFDDGSTDGSLEIIETYLKAHPEIKLLRHPGGVNKGLAKTLKSALGCVKTEYIAFLECDDYLHPDYLKEKARIFQQNPEIKIIYNDVECFGLKGRVRKLNLYYKAVNFYLSILNPFSKNYNFVFALFSFNPVPTFSCVAARADIFDNLDFNPPFAPWLDWWLWAQLAFKNKFYRIDTKLTTWRLRKESLTMSTLGQISKNALPFENELDKLYAANLPPFKYFTVKYISQILQLAYALVSLPVKLIYRAFTAEA